MDTPLTRQQLNQLIEEYQELLDWTTVKSYCTQVYGEGKSTNVAISTYGEYNDEGSINYHNSSITAYDTNDTILTFDLSLPFWQQPCFADIQQKIAVPSNEEQRERDEYRRLKLKYEPDQAPLNDEDIQEEALCALKEYYPLSDEDEALAEKHCWLMWDQLPVDKDKGGTAIYNLTTEPVISFPVVAGEGSDASSNM